MNSWKLFTRAILAWETYENPVFMRESEHRPVWYGTSRWLTIAGGPRTALVLGSSLAWILIVLFVNNLLIFLIPPLLFLTVATALTLAPIVVQERLSHSWESLLTTPYGADTILLSKVAGALAWLRTPTLIIGTLLGVIAAGVGLLSLVLVPTSALRGGLELTVCGVLMLVPLVGGALFLADRVQQYMLMIAAALAASASSRSLRNAFPAATAAVLLVWLGESLAAAAIVGLTSGRAVLFDPARLLALVTLGPTVIYISEFGLGRVALFGLGTLLLREALIVALWRWSVWRARPQAG